MRNGLNKTVAYYEDVVNNAKKAFATSEGFAYYCPYCYEKELDSGVIDPKPDTSGKLYINSEHKTGICFRCNTVIVSSTKKDRLVLELNAPEQDLSILSNLSEIDLSSVPPAYQSDEAMQYLSSRNVSLTSVVVKKLDLRWIDTMRTVKDLLGETQQIRRTGILAPLRYRGAIRSYQIRYITTSKKSRFHTMEGKKILWMFKEPPKYSEITLAEGVYDAIALACMGFPYPVAMLGKTLTELQIAQLRELVPYRINLCLDEYIINNAMKYTLRKQLKSTESYKMWGFSGSKDPEEYYKAHPDFRYSKKSKPIQIREI